MIPLVVGAFVQRENGDVLCFRRSRREGVQFPGQWCFPGGKPGSHENLFYAVSRELWEETGYVMGRGEEMCRIRLDPPYVRASITLVYFKVHRYFFSPENYVPEEGTEVAWHPWRELVSPPEGRIYTPGTTRLVERIQAGVYK